MKLLCIDDSPSEATHHFQQWVQEGQVYTVRRTEGSLYQGQRVLLKELRNDPVWINELQMKAEPGFSMQRFVPVDDLMNVVEEKVRETNVVLQ